jgi:proteic killer suppression protein
MLARGCLGRTVTKDSRQSLNLVLLRATYRDVIRSFADKRTAAIWADRMPKGFPSDLAKASRRKLRALAAATRLEDLRQPPANHLEALRGDRRGQHSIRVNDQWRLCFVWRDSDAYDVEIVDYHGG